MALRAIDPIIYPIIHQVNWPVQNVVAFTTTKQTSHSVIENSTYAQFDFFNIGDHVGDNPENIIINRQQLLSFLPNKTKIQWLKQVHGSDVVTLNSHQQNSVVADAVITQKSHLALAIMTADCLPVFLSTITGDEIAAIHGGWKPLSKNIIENTVALMKAKPKDIVAWLGPCIGSQVFEVGQEVRECFMQQSSQFLSAFTQVNSTSNQPKYLMNLHLIAKIQLKALGVNNTYCLEHCTYSLPDQYYSYRRDGQTGRMASVICRK